MTTAFTNHTCPARSRRGANSRRRASRGFDRAFTLIELLVVLALIALIIGILLIAMGGVRSSTRRLESSNAIRQMVVAYDAYSTDHNKRLMPGYVTAAETISLDILPKREDDTLHDDEDSQSYVWRLAPYLNNNWQTMFVDYGSERVNSKLSDEYRIGVYGPGTITDAAKQYGISRIPSFGLNCIFLGGDSVHGGPMTDFSPWNTAGNDPIAATRFSEVKSPAKMIVFAPTAQANDAFNPSVSEFRDIVFGCPELRPPYLELLADGTWGDQQWSLAGDGSTLQVTDNPAFAEGGGLPIARWGGTTFPVGNLDGSTTNETYTSIVSDMTRWSPKAKGMYVD